MSVYKHNSFHIRMNAQTDIEGKMLKKGNHNVPKAIKNFLVFLRIFLDDGSKLSVCLSGFGTLVKKMLNDIVLVDKKYHQAKVPGSWSLVLGY